MYLKEIDDIVQEPVLGHLNLTELFVDEDYCYFIFSIRFYFF